LKATKSDTVVIGSGISGLTTAALLAQNGREVVIVESGRRPGGVLRRFSRGGIPFDVGFHYTGGLGKGQILRALWDCLGVSAAIPAIPLHPEGYDLLRIQGCAREVRAYYEYEQLEEELCTVFPGESGGIRQYLATLREVCRAVPFYNPALAITPFLRGSTADRPLASVLTELTDSPALRAALCAPAFLYGVPPARAGLAMHAVVAHGYYSGTWGIAGGGEAIIEALLARLAEWGVEIRPASPARTIKVAEDRATGVAGEDWEIAAGTVIYTGHPHHLPGLLPTEALRPAYRDRLLTLGDTVSMFILFGEVAAATPLSLLDRANLYLLRPGFDLLETTVTSGSGSLMVTAPGRHDGAASPAARGVILMRPASLDEVAGFDREGRTRAPGYEELKNRVAEEMLTQATDFGDDFRSIRPLAVGSPLTFRDELGSPGGGIYGVRHSRDQYIAGARTKLPGLYLSGQGSLMTGIMGASLAGLVTAGEILGLEKIWDKVREWC